MSDHGLPWNVQSDRGTYGNIRKSGWNRRNPHYLAHDSIAYIHHGRVLFCIQGQRNVIKNDGQ